MTEGRIQKAEGGTSHSLVGSMTSKCGGRKADSGTTDIPVG